MADWETRQAQAFETFEKFVPEAEPGRVLAAMERNLGALGTFAFTTVGEMWSRPQLGVNGVRFTFGIRSRCD